MNEKRIASMDVLRIVLTIFVITLHFNNLMGGGEEHLFIQQILIMS